MAISAGCWLPHELRPAGRAAAHGPADEDIAALTQQLTSIVESWVRETPEQWLWLHRRWKTRPSLETALAPAPAPGTAPNAPSHTPEEPA